MIQSTLKETEGAWGTRALIRALSLVVFLFLLHAPWPPLRQHLQTWLSQGVPAGLLPLSAIGLLISAILLIIVHRFMRYLSPLSIALLSGQVFSLGWLRRHFLAKQYRLVEKVKSRPELMEQLRLWYPEAESEVRPSRLGNILRAAELYPLVRYEMEAIVLWPRLVPLIPDREMKSLEQEKDALLFFLELSLATLASALFWTVARPLWGFGPHPVLIAAAFLASYGLYRLSLEPATNLGRQIRVCVDLYRIPLLTALGQKEPENLLEEQAIWRRINAYLLTGDGDRESLEQLFVRPKSKSSSS